MSKKDWVDHNEILWLTYKLLQQNQIPHDLIRKVLEIVPLQIPFAAKITNIRCSEEYCSTTWCCNVAMWCVGCEKYLCGCNFAEYAHFVKDGLRTKDKTPRHNPTPYYCLLHSITDVNNDTTLDDKEGVLTLKLYRELPPKHRYIPISSHNLKICNMIRLGSKLSQISSIIDYESDACRIEVIFTNNNGVSYEERSRLKLVACRAAADDDDECYVSWCGHRRRRTQRPMIL